MKKFKKALAVLLAGAMALAVLTACGGGAGGGKEPQHVTGAFSTSTSKVTIGKAEVIYCKVEAYSMARSPEKYKWYEYLSVSFGVENQSNAPLDLERSASEWYQMNSALAVDYDAAYDGWFAKESKYLTAKVDGKAAKASGYYMVMEGQAPSATVLGSKEYGSVRLIVLAPEGWTSLDVTFAPSNANGESAVFHLTQADVSKRTMADGTLMVY